MLSLLRLVAGVRLGGGLGGHFLGMAIEDEAVAGGERSEFHFRRGVEARGVEDARATHLLGLLDRGLAGAHALTLAAQRPARALHVQSAGVWRTREPR
jgi:hypothetical protein